MKKSKCNFGVTSVEYLGHIITAVGVATDPKKIAAMKEWPQPRNLKQLRRFLGLTGYYQRFIKDYGVISRPLANLLKKDNFGWSSEARMAFETLKEALSKRSCVGSPYFSEAICG